LTVYLDTSALVKLVVIEKESRALRTFLQHEPEQFSCAIARTELLRAVHRGGSAAIEDARRVLRNLHLIHLGDALLDAAGLLDPVKMRSLDAIHLAAAALIAPELTGLVTYDKRMAEGAAHLGFPVVSPA
jgi:predicted nucleic acid-binding protein